MRGPADGHRWDRDFVDRADRRVHRIKDLAVVRRHERPQHRLLETGRLIRGEFDALRAIVDGIEREDERWLLRAGVDAVRPAPIGGGDDPAAPATGLPLVPGGPGHRCRRERARRQIEPADPHRLRGGGEIGEIDALAIRRDRHELVWPVAAEFEARRRSRQRIDDGVARHVLVIELDRVAGQDEPAAVAGRADGCVVVEERVEVAIDRERARLAAARQLEHADLRLRAALHGLGRIELGPVARQHAVR